MAYYTCPVCQSQFRRDKVNLINPTCSRVCKNKRQTIAKIISSNCPVCHKDFIYKYYDSKKPGKQQPCCSIRCSAILQGGKPSKDVWDRFWSKVKIGSVDECWEWQSHTNPYGYGKFRVGNSMTLAHRVAYELIYGKLPDSKTKVCHKCDNRLCCNWHHHFAGTQADNVHDAMSKGKMWFQKPNCRNL